MQVVNAFHVFLLFYEALDLNFVPEIWACLGLKGNPFCGLLNIINGLNW
jgi:hypothetical protein